MKIELVYDSDCPNAEQARINLEQALKQSGIKTEWKEWNRQNENIPSYLKRYGSPTILINGKDIVENMPDSQSDSCRVYADKDGYLQGVPSVEAIKDAINNQQSRLIRSRFGGILAAVPAIGIAFLPKIVCPLCWPAYAGILSAIGLGFLLTGTNLLIISTVFLGMSLIVFGLRGKARGNFIPFGIAFAGIFMLLAGKFFFDNLSLFYTGTFFLTGAVFADIWPFYKSQNCNDCNKQYERG